MKVFGTKAEKRRYYRRLRIKIYAGAGIAALVVVGIIYGMFHAPFLKITAVEVRGVANADQIRMAVIGSWRGRVFGADNFLAWPGMIGGVSIEKHYGEGKVVLVGEPADRFAIWCATACVWVNQKGTALEGAPDTDGGAVAKVNDARDFTPALGQPVLPVAQFAAVAGVLAGMKDLPITIEKYTFDNDLEELIATPTSGGRLIFSVRFVPNDKLFGSLKNLITGGQVRSAEYLDFTVENRIYVK